MNLGRTAVLKQDCPADQLLISGSKVSRQIYVLPNYLFNCSESVLALSVSIGKFLLLVV